MPVRTQATISDSVMRAILAMDSYNRGFRPGLDFREVSTVTGAMTDLGNARITHLDTNVFSEAALRQSGFSATAYSWNGETIISYRGTD